MAISPDGRKIAYVLQVPDVSANENNEDLYVTGLQHGPKMQPAVLVASNRTIEAIHWFPDNRHLAALLRHGQRIVLTEIDSIAKTQAVIWQADNDITDYSMDSSGRTIAIGVRIAPHVEHPSEASRDSKRGYRLDRSSISHSEGSRRRIYILRHADNDHWVVSSPIKVVSPLSGKTIDNILDNHSLSINLSPNGRMLLLDTTERFLDIRKEGGWQESHLAKYVWERGGANVYVSYLYDLETGQTSMPLESPYSFKALWAQDSRSYMQVALAPVGSEWERLDLAKNTPTEHMTHLFSVEVSTGMVSEVLSRAEKLPVAWTRSGEVIVRNPSGTLTTFRKTLDRWIPTDTKSIVPAGGATYSAFVSDGDHAVMEYQDARTAPELVAWDLKSGQSWVIVKLNPQIENFTLPKTERISWTTATGYTAEGLLLLPPDYDPHRRYPLAIENGSILYSGEFVCDSGVNHVPAFTRGILADAGVMYLMRYWPGIDDWKTNYYSKGLPGGISEAAFQQDLVESAVKYLDQRKMIDPTRLGLIGFSRGGWYVDYMLVHSAIPFAVASTYDNVQYSLGEYWYMNNERTARQWAAMYGGPPYGKSLKNWLDYSISFNLDKVHTPLLMEIMGYGKKYDDPDSPPDNLAMHNEVFVGLSELHKPVEYYYYPNEGHQPDHPEARIASLQRNVDWFLFWLQGYERTDPRDADQYKRWEQLRSLRKANQSGSVKGTEAQ